MNTLWLKIAGLAVVVLGLITQANVVFTSEPEPIEQQRSEQQEQEVGDGDLRPEPKVKPQVEGVPNPKVDYVAKINELAREGRDENLNAAPFYQEAIDLYVESGEKLRNKLYSRPRPVRLDELSDKERSLLEEWVLSNSQALSQLELGTKKPCYWVERFSQNGSVMGILIPELAEFRQLSHAITWCAKLSAAQGNIDKAMKNILTCYRCGLHQTGHKTLIEQMVGIAIRGVAVQTTFIILDETTIDRASLETLQREIEQLSTDDSYVPDMRAEKFFILDIIQRTFTDDGKGDGRIHLESIRPMLTAPNSQEQSLEKLQRRKTIEEVEKLYEYFDFIGHKTPWQWKKEQINPKQEIEKIMEGNAFIQEFCPAFIRVIQIFGRARAENDALIITLALLRYKANNGQLPDKLDKIVSVGYLKTLPTDPFSSGPFVYKRIGDNFMLYSFGEDCDDDSGARSKGGTGEKDGDQVFWPVERKSK